MPTVHSVPIAWMWLLLPTLVAVVSVSVLLKWRRFVLPFSAAVSCCIFLATCVLIPISWDTRKEVVASWHVWPSSGSINLRNWEINANCGGIAFTHRYRRFIDRTTLPSDFDLRKYDSDRLTITWWSDPTFPKYPAFDSPLNVTHGWPWIEKAGFFLIYVSDPKMPNGEISYCSVTLPQWSLLVPCPWAPLLLWRRWARRRFRVKKGLCLKCGFDLRAHQPGQKCPTCGTLILSRPGGAASVVTGQVAPAPSDPPAS